LIRAIRIVCAHNKFSILIKDILKSIVYILLISLISGICLYGLIVICNAYMEKEVVRQRAMQYTTVYDCIGIALFYCTSAFLLFTLLKGMTRKKVIIPASWLYGMILFAEWLLFHLLFNAMDIYSVYFYAEIVSLLISAVVLAALYKMAEKKVN
jgi:hypothetical protein